MTDAYGDQCTFDLADIELYKSGVLYDDLTIFTRDNSYPGKLIITHTKPHSTSIYASGIARLAFFRFRASQISPFMQDYKSLPITLQVILLTKR